MEYDYTGVTEIRHDREKRRLELVSHGKRVVVDGVDQLMLKSVPFVDARGVAHLNHGRVSIGKGEAVAGD